jgi:hypothetical protein
MILYLSVKDFPSTLRVQTSSGTHPVSYPVGIWGKARPGRDADHSPPSGAYVKNEYELYPLSLSACIASSGTALLYYTTVDTTRTLAVDTAP